MHGAVLGLEATNYIAGCDVIVYHRIEAIRKAWPKKFPQNFYSVIVLRIKFQKLLL